MGSKYGIGTEYLCEFGYGLDREVSYEDLQVKIKEYKRQGYSGFIVAIDYGYYEGEEHLALYGKKV